MLVLVGKSTKHLRWNANASIYRMGILLEGLYDFVILVSMGVIIAPVVYCVHLELHVAPYCSVQLKTARLVEFGIV